jgi:hypothetical protein
MMEIESPAEACCSVCVITETFMPVLGDLPHRHGPGPMAQPGRDYGFMVCFQLLTKP